LRDIPKNGCEGDYIFILWMPTFYIYTNFSLFQFLVLDWLKLSPVYKDFEFYPL